MEARLDLLWRAARTPQAPALEAADVVLSFADLAAGARRAAAWICATAPAGDAPVAMLLEGDARFAVWFHALALARRTVLPLNLRLTVPELAQQLETARVTWLLGDARDVRLSELAARLPGLTVEPAPPLATLAEAAAWVPAAPADPNTTLAVLFTSGTTGRAKGVCLSWGNFHASGLATAERLGEMVEQRWLACLPLFHVGGISILLRGIMFGGPIRLQQRFDAAAVSAALDGGDIAAVSLVPTMLSRLLTHRAGRPAPPALRAVLLGGAAAAPELLARALAAGYPVCPTYGLTEATSQVATAPPPPRGASCAGPLRPLPGTSVRIIAEGLEAGRGEPGEIVVRGPTVMQGYLHDAAASARALREGWLYTGDVGYFDAAGGLQVLDRRDDLIVSGGENVYPAEIEAVLLDHPAVDDAGVTGVADSDLGARVEAWIVRAAGAKLDVEMLRQHCRRCLAGYKQPRAFHFVDALPRNAAGKLWRRRLPACAVLD